MGRTRAGKGKKLNNKMEISWGCAASQIIWLLLSLGFCAFDHVANYWFRQMGLIHFLKLFFYPYRTEPRLAAYFHNTFSSLFVRLVMHPFWRCGESMQIPSRFVPEDFVDDRLDYVQWLGGYTQISLMT